MQTAIKTHAPDKTYILISMVVAISAAVINFLGSPETAVGVALLAWVTSMLGFLVKTS
jgi:hypothetical protein